MNLEEKKAALIEELSLFPDYSELLEHVMSQGKNAGGLPDNLRIENFEIKGCVAQLWLVPEFRDGRCYFTPDAERGAFISLGVASVVCDFYSGAKPEEIVATDMEFLRGKLDLALTQNRRNGLSQVIKSIQRFAKSCMADS